MLDGLPQRHLAESWQMQLTVRKKEHVQCSAPNLKKMRKVIPSPLNPSDATSGDAVVLTLP